MTVGPYKAFRVFSKLAFRSTDITYLFGPIDLTTIYLLNRLGLTYTRLLLASFASIASMS